VHVSRGRGKILEDMSEGGKIQAHLCAEEVEAEAVDIMNGFKPKADACHVSQIRLDVYKANMS